jgi:hypothetical protein
LQKIQRITWITDPETPRIGRRHIPGRTCAHV